jgi:hypothetical protein
MATVLAQRLVDVAHRDAIAPHRFAVATVDLVDQSEDPGETAVGLAAVAVLDPDRATPTPRNGQSSRRVNRVSVVVRNSPGSGSSATSIAPHVAHWPCATVGAPPHSGHSSGRSR